MAKLITFDCYGTLVDLNLGRSGLDLLGDRVQRHNFDVDRFLHDYFVIRFQACLSDYVTYDDMLRSTLEHAMTLHGLTYTPEDGDAVVAWVPSRGPFPEVPGALRRLKEKYEIGIISNSDDDLLAKNVANIGIEFDHVITAEQLGAYKPRAEAFQEAWRRMGAAPHEIVHVAQGWEYDIMPTASLGVARRVWINRSGLPGSDEFRPYDELTDLSGLPALLDA